MTNLKKGDRVWIFEEGAPVRRSGIITGDMGFTDRMTTIWPVRLDGENEDVALPGKVLKKTDDS